MNEPEDYVSDDEDFSASEDEWQPDKNEKASSDEDYDVSSSNEDVIQSPPIKKRKTKIKNTRKLIDKSLRYKMFQKYKNSTASLLNKSHRSEIKSFVSTNQNHRDDTDSDSSVDNHLVKIENLDLMSKFFTSTSSSTEKTSTPNFDCNIGLRLSDCESESDGSKISNEQFEKTAIGKSNIDFKQHQNFAANIQAAKDQLGKLKSKSRKHDQNAINTDVSKLLALGELSSGNKVEANKVKYRHIQSDSDWEEVDDAKVEDAVKTSTIRDVQITVAPNEMPIKKSAKEDDFQAALRREINRRKREIQLVIHKVHILGWIGHVNHINVSLNHSYLMKLCLEMLPSPQSYPKGRTDKKYFDEITKWYSSKICLKDDRNYPKLDKTPDLLISLGLQIKTRAAICRRDFVLIFIILLRSLGLQCRLIMNLVTVPIRPPIAELCSFKERSVDSKKCETNKKIERPKNQKNEKSTENLQNTSTFKHTVEHTSQLTNKIIKSKYFSRKKNRGKTSPEPSTSRAISHEIKLSQSNSNIKTNDNLLKLKASPIAHRTRRLASKQIDIKLDLSPSSKSTNRKRTTHTENTVPVKKLKVSAKNLPTRQQEGKPQSSVNTAVKDPITSKYFPPSNANTITTSPISKRTRQQQRIIPQNAKQKIISEIKFPQVDGAVSDEAGQSVKTVKNTRKKTQNVIDKKDISPIKPKVSTKLNIEMINSKKTSPNSTSNTTKNSKISKRKNVKKNDEPAPKTTNSELSTVTSVTKIDRRILSSDEDDGINGQEAKESSKKNAINFWVEVYCEADSVWMPVDLFKKKVNCAELIKKSATKPLSYVFAWNSDKTIKDVTARYCTQWHTITRKMRVDQKWLDETMKSFKATRNAANNPEDRELNMLMQKEPLPTAISDFKNHPLYVLERHLLKFEGIYPPNSLTLGYIRNEPIYARDCVHTLHSREIWVKQARTVKLGEKPYKIVKARPKWNRATGTMLAPAPLEIFGHWQTQPYEPPTAENGIVPRNPYGNVELFKPEMLPHNTVHLQCNMFIIKSANLQQKKNDFVFLVPGLNKTCKKLDIDCAQAVVGFDFHSGSSHPTFDGFVICQEFAKRAVEQWWKDQEEAERREEEKFTQRVYGRWKKLIKCLLIREHLQTKYNFKNSDNNDDIANEKKRKKKQ